MQQATRFPPHTQTGLHEYVLSVYPDRIVTDKVMIAKKNFKTRCRERDENDSKPQIMIASFVAHEAMEETVLRYSQRICSRQQSFEVALNNYSGLPPHTI